MHRNQAISIYIYIDPALNLFTNPLPTHAEFHTCKETNGNQTCVLQYCMSSTVPCKLYTAELT